MERFKRNSRKNALRKKTGTNSSLNKARIESQVMQEELQNGLELVDRVRKERAYIVAQLENEVKFQEELKDKINYLKNEYRLLQQSYVVNKKSLEETRRQRMELEEEVSSLEQVHERVLNSIETASFVVQDDFSRLLEVINMKAERYQKEKSILLTCIKGLIDTTEDNEFSDFTWKVKVSHTASFMGARIRFENISLQQSDLKEFYKPVIEEFGRRFGHYNLSIQTKTKKQHGVVHLLDMTLRVPLMEAEVHTPKRPELF